MTRQLGYRLRRLRDASGLTQQQVADAAGITRAYLSLIENGHRWPPYTTLECLATALDAGPAALIGLFAAVAERRQDLREVQPVLAANPPLVGLLRFLGTQHMHDEELGMVGRAIGQIMVLRRHRSGARRAPPSATDDGGTDVA